MKEQFLTEIIIPKKIIQTWKDKNLTNNIHKECQKQLLDLHPDYEYIFYDDNEMYAFMEKEFPQYWTAFKNLKYKIQQIDIFRLCAVYYHGGIYLDLDIFLNRKLDGMLNIGSLIFPIEFNPDYIQCKLWKNSDRFISLDCNSNKYVTLGNYGFASSQHNIILKKMIDIIFADYNTTTDILENKNQFHLQVYRTTGPDKITELYYKNPDIKKEIILIENTNTDKCCQFGIYGSHIMTGSWKNDDPSSLPEQYLPQ